MYGVLDFKDFKLFGKENTPSQRSVYIAHDIMICGTVGLAFTLCCILKFEINQRYNDTGNSVHSFLGCNRQVNDLQTTNSVNLTFLHFA